MPVGFNQLGLGTWRVLCVKTSDNRGYSHKEGREGGLNS